MSKEKADELGIKPLCTIKSYASAGVDPKIMGVGPVPACKKALDKAGLKVEDLDLIEANEAFAAQAAACVQDLKLDPEIVNVNGGAVALGHAVGCTGARISLTLMREMQRRKVQYGVASLCIGGGQAMAMMFELCE